LRNGELIHRDSVEAPGLHLVVLPCLVAQVFEHQDLPVRATDIRRRTFNFNLSIRQSTTTALSTGTLTYDPISVPFECHRLAALDETVAIVALGAIQRALGGSNRGRRERAMLLRTRQFRHRHVVLAASQVEDLGRTEMESLHGGDFVRDR
jgi:hypothetical protein